MQSTLQGDFLVRPGGFEPLAFRVGELRQGSVTRRRNVNFIGSAHLPSKQEKARCWLSQQAFSVYYSATAR